MKLLFFILMSGTLLVSCVEKKKQSRDQESYSSQSHIKKEKRTPAKEISLADSFSRNTGLTPGSFKTVSPDPTSCLEGDVEILNVGGSLTLMVGGRMLVGDIKKKPNNISFSEGGCTYKFTVIWDDSKISSLENRKCGMDTVTISKIVQVSKNKINYTVTSKINKKPESKVSCELEREK